MPAVVELAAGTPHMWRDPELRSQNRAVADYYNTEPVEGHRVFEVLADVTPQERPLVRVSNKAAPPSPDASSSPTTLSSTPLASTLAQFRYTAGYVGPGWRRRRSGRADHLGVADVGCGDVGQEPGRFREGGAKTVQAGGIMARWTASRSHPR
jgi:hypothetical protein